jgi:glycosyltransferase involved in cell wall biosynthesis
MVYYEAWAYGKPVIAMDLPVLRESIGAHEGGILVDTTSDSLSAAMKRLLGDKPLRERLGINGQLLAKLHTWERATESYLEFYRQVIRKYEASGKQ